MNYNAKVIGITGTNGKSTTTALTYHLLKNSGYKVELGGNFGVPVLDLVHDNIDSNNIYVLELSSFQLEISDNLKLHSAIILNLSPDHLDRYNSLADYYNAKYKIYSNADNIIINNDCKELVSFIDSTSDIDKDPLAFSYSDLSADFYVKDNFIYCKGFRILEINNLPLFGSHNVYNIMASLALIFSLLDFEDINRKCLKLKSIVENIFSFQGLEHRCEVFLDTGSILWINDSNGTNLDATCAALKGAESMSYHKLWLVLGGILKENDFSEIRSCLNSLVKRNKLNGIVVFGQSKQDIYNNLLSENTKDFLFTQDDLDSLVKFILDKDTEVKDNKDYKKAKDIVLFSPACASFDMFENYMHRGILFKRIVKQNYNGTK